MGPYHYTSLSSYSSWPLPLQFLISPIKYTKLQSSFHGSLSPSVGLGLRGSDGLNVASPPFPPTGRFSVPSLRGAHQRPFCIPPSLKTDSKSSRSASPFRFISFFFIPSIGQPQPMCRCVSFILRSGFLILKVSGTTAWTNPLPSFRNFPCL